MANEDIYRDLGYYGAGGGRLAPVDSVIQGGNSLADTILKIAQLRQAMDYKAAETQKAQADAQKTQQEITPLYKNLNLPSSDEINAQIAANKSRFNDAQQAYLKEQALKSSPPGPSFGPEMAEPVAQPLNNPREQYSKSLGLSDEQLNLTPTQLKEIAAARALGNTTVPVMTTEDALKAGQVKKGTIIKDNKPQNPELSPSELAFMGQQFLTTGEMPNLGMGASGTRIQIIKEAARQAAAEGLTGKALALNKAAFHASSLELNKLQGIRGSVESFANTATQNLDLAAQLSDAVDRTGTPVVDRWLNAGKRATGDPAIAQFDAALRTAVNGYAKVTTAISGGGAGSVSDAARNEIDSLLNSANSPQQIKAVISTLKTEMGNRQQGLNSQIQQIRSQITSGQSTVNPAKPGPAKPAPAATLDSMLQDSRITVEMRNKAMAARAKGFSDERIMQAIKKDAGIQ